MSDGSFWGVERRRAARALLKTDLFYSVEPPPEVKMQFQDRSETACLVDLGEGGIGFVSEAELPQNTKLDITFKLNSKEQGDVEIHVSGVVKYCFPQGDYSTFRVGLEFTDMDQDTKGLILEYVKNFKAF